MLKKIKKVFSEDREVNQLQENIEQVITPIIDKQILDGIIIKSISLIAGQDNPISHKLSRPLRGWVIVRKREQSDIWDTQDTNTQKSRTLNLQCSTNVTVDLWVF